MGILETIRQALVTLLILGGVFFFGVGTLGLLRLPDAITRMHAAAKADTLGAGLVILGVIVRAGFSPVTLKLLVIMCFVWFTAPTATHVIARVAYRDGAFPPVIRHRLNLGGKEGGGTP